MRRQILPLIFISSWVLGDFEVPKAFSLYSTNGTKVELVAIYSTSPEGFTFSPKPTAPLIGSNKIQVLTTSWNNIDVDRLPKEMDVAYQSAQAGKTIQLKIGNFFTDIAAAANEAKSNIPVHRFSTNYSVSYKIILTDKDTFRRHHELVSSSVARNLRDRWLSIANELKKIDYRSDAIKLIDELESAAKAIDTLSNAGSSFNVSAGRDIESLLR